MAMLGQDARLSGLLLEVALDLDAEADLIEAGMDRERRSAPRLPASFVPVRMWSLDPGAPGYTLTLTDLSAAGARLSGSVPWPIGTPVILEFLDCGIRIAARIVRLEPEGIGLAFESDRDTALLVDQVVHRLARAHRPAPAGDHPALMRMPG
jgi:hypothetical protein